MSGKIMLTWGPQGKRGFKVIFSHDSAANKRKGKRENERIREKLMVHGLIDDEFSGVVAALLKVKDVGGTLMELIITPVRERESGA